MSLTKRRRVPARAASGEGRSADTRGYQEREREREREREGGQVFSEREKGVEYERSRAIFGRLRNAVLATASRGVA